MQHWIIGLIDINAGKTEERPGPNYLLFESLLKRIFKVGYGLNLEQIII
jgi:hypothetical protein